MTEPDPKREWWTPHEVEELYRVHISTIYRWIHIGKLRAVRFRRNLYRIRREDVEALAEKPEHPEGLKATGAPATCKDCRKSDGWLSIDLECGIDTDPMCDYHSGLALEQQGHLRMGEGELDTALDEERDDMSPDGLLGGARG